jgi:hypothetical protein
VKIYFPKSKIKVMEILPSQKKPQCNELNFSDEVKILNLLKGSMALVEVGWCYGKNELSICSVQDKEHEIRSTFS